MLMEFLIKKCYCNLYDIESYCWQTYPSMPELDHGNPYAALEFYNFCPKFTFTQGVSVEQTFLLLTVVYIKHVINNCMKEGQEVKRYIEFYCIGCHLYISFLGYLLVADLPHPPTSLKIVGGKTAPVNRGITFVRNVA